MAPLTPQDWQVLVRARELVERGWCRRPLATDTEGAPCHPNATGAVAWSTHGALMRAAYELDLAVGGARDYARDRCRELGYYLTTCDWDPSFSRVDAVWVLS